MHCLRDAGQHILFHGLEQDDLHAEEDGPKQEAQPHQGARDGGHAEARLQAGGVPGADHLRALRHSQVKDLLPLFSEINFNQSRGRIAKVLGLR